jgi:lysozyme
VPPAARERRKHLSPRGYALIKRFEGLRLTAYRASRSEPHLTIGYGDYGPHVRPGQRITRAEADRRFHRRLREFELAVNRHVTTPITQGQFDALVSFAYNVGAGAFEGSTLLKRVNQRRWKAARLNFYKWVFAGGIRLLGLTRRRRAEARLFWRSRPRKRKPRRAAA